MNWVNFGSQCYGISTKQKGEDLVQLLTYSMNYWPQNAQMADALSALLIADNELFGGSNYCDILLRAEARGMEKALSVQDYGSCEGVSTPPTYRVNLDDKDEYPTTPSCGSIGSFASSSWGWLILLAPLLLRLRRNDEA